DTTNDGSDEPSEPVSRPSQRQVITNPSVLTDPLLANIRRTEVDGRTVLELGGIQIISKIGQGGMGAVYYGFHPRLNQDVAIKVLPMQMALRKPESVNRFIR